MTNFEIISQTLLDNNFQLQVEQINKLEKFYDLLIDYNTKINLTSITDIYEVSLKHFVDSLFHMKHYKENSTVLDIGTGAGFPGIPLAIARSDLQITLVDSLNKRVDFLNLVIKELDLQNVKAFHSRAQEFCTKEYREKFDYCIARAVAPLNILLELCLPFVAINGEFVGYKSLSLENELKEADFAINTLGGKLITISKYMLNTKLLNTIYPQKLEYNEPITRNIVEISKIKHTKTIYPRLKNIIKLNPLTNKKK